MTNYKTRLTLVTVSVALAAMFWPVSDSAAQGPTAATTDLSAQQDKDKKKATPQKPATPAAAPRVAPQRVAPIRTAPVHVAPRTVAPIHTAPNVVKQQNVKRQRTVIKQQNVNKQQKVITQQNVTKRSNVVKQQRVAPRMTSPSSQKFVAPKAARTFTPRGTNAKIVTASRLRAMPARGAGRAVIRGQNYSVWRSGYRIRRGGGWRTFVALGALGAIIVGGSQFYPYAYISAPEDYCDGLTEDGCQLVYQEVETLEGDVIPQCVAYCPWQ